MSDSSGVDYVALNRQAWNSYAAEYASAGERAWAEREPSWGIFSIPESLAHLLPDDLAGKDVIELGCGTAYVSAWLARLGARPVGIDNSPKQLETARRLQNVHGLEFPLHLGNAETTPFPDASFDLAISEYGASIWCDPFKLIPEAARLLRPGGELVFLVNGTIAMLCAPDGPEEPARTDLQRPYFGMHRFDWGLDESIEFHLGYGDMIRLLRQSGFEVEDLKELRPPDGSTTTYPYMSLDWAQRWPAEEVWKARKR